MAIKTTPLEDMLEIQSYLMQLRLKLQTDDVGKNEVEMVIEKTRRVIASIENKDTKKEFKELIQKVITSNSFDSAMRARELKNIMADMK